MSTILDQSADIVFLQEVIPETFSYIESKLPNYECLAAKEENYFVATLLRKGRVYLDRHKVGWVELVGSYQRFCRLWTFLAVQCTDTCWQSRPTAARSDWI